MYIGIDLGTTNSAIAGTTGADLRIFKTPDGMDTLPSVIYIDKRGHRLFGKKAYDQTLLSPGNVAAGFKRLMGTSTKILLESNDGSLTPEECSAAILRQLIAQAFTESGASELTGTVITIPAAFNQMQSEATLLAAKMAGISQVALLQEPIAAAMAAMAHAKNKSGQFLVYDFGGGTFDLALVQSLAGAINIISHEGINMLGGRDFDRAIVNSFIRPWLLDKFNLPKDFQKVPKYNRVLGIARIAAEKAKIALSANDSETIFASDDEIRVKDEDGKDIYLEIELSRKDLESLIEEDVMRTIQLTRKMLHDNGYASGDIDRIVFVGGPTKMPYVRDTVPRELGIPVDLQVDPMTAVALGAAIFAESREWTGESTKRKATRKSGKASEALDLKYDYPARTSDDRAKIRVKSGNPAETAGFEFQIDSSAGWTSGRKPISADDVVDVQLPEMGDNAFRITIFDAHGKPLTEASSQFVIKRTHANSAGIPATQTISVKVKESSEAANNVLHPIIKKGTQLPAQGTERFSAARDLKSGDLEGHLDFELFQDEGAKEPDLNLQVGVFRIPGSDLEPGMSIREGDEIIFHWEMSDSGILQATLELPTVGQIFSTKKYYVAQAGHQAFDIETGSKNAQNILNETESDLEDLKEVVDHGNTAEIDRIEKELNNQKAELEKASDADTTRSIAESGRHMRQAISKMRNAPENKGRALAKDIDEIEERFNSYAREFVDEKSQELFETNLINARTSVGQADEKSIRDAEAHLNVLRNIFGKGLWQNPIFLEESYRYAASTAHNATDKKLYSKLLQNGVAALEAKDWDELRRIVIKLGDLRVSVDGPKDRVDKLASIMRLSA